MTFFGCIIVFMAWCGSDPTTRQVIGGALVAVVMTALTYKWQAQRFVQQQENEEP